MEVEIPGIGDFLADSPVTTGKDTSTLDGKTSHKSEAGDQMVIP